MTQTEIMLRTYGPLIGLVLLLLVAFTLLFRRSSKAAKIYWDQLAEIEQGILVTYDRLATVKTRAELKKVFEYTWVPLYNQIKASRIDSLRVNHDIDKIQGMLNGMLQVFDIYDPKEKERDPNKSVEFNWGPTH